MSRRARPPARPPSPSPPPPVFRCSPRYRPPTATRSPKRCCGPAPAVREGTRRRERRVASRSRRMPGDVSLLSAKGRWRSLATGRGTEGVLRSEASSSETHCRGARWLVAEILWATNLPRIVPAPSPLQWCRFCRRPFGPLSAASHGRQLAAWRWRASINLATERGNPVTPAAQRLWDLPVAGLARAAGAARDPRVAIGWLERGI